MDIARAEGMNMGELEPIVPATSSTDEAETSRFPWAQNDSVRWAIRAMRYYLITAGVILFFYWDGWSELGPNYLLVGFLSWPVLNILGWLLEIFHLQLDVEQDKIFIVSVILLTGMVNWGAIGFLCEKINRWRML